MGREEAQARILDNETGDAIKGHEGKSQDGSKDGMEQLIVKLDLE